MSGALVGSPCAAAYRVRREEEFHALHVCGGGAVALVHITATDPLGARRHSDLIGAAIAADRGGNGVGAVEKVIARLGRVVAAGVAAAVVNGVMPVEIVVCHCSIPAAVVRFKRVMRPANARIGARNNNSLPGESLRPDVRRVCINDSRFDRRRRPRLQRPFSRAAG